MKYVIVGIIVVIALLVWGLNRRGASGLGSSGSSDTEAGALGQGTHQQQNHLNPGGGA